jgi:hypothetical protein
MAAPFPTQVALIVCRVLFVGEPDVNSEFTGWRNTEWDMSQGVMHCRREIVEVYDPSVDQGAATQPFNPAVCMRTVMRMGPQFDVDHRDKPWRFWRAACPVPMLNNNGTPDDQRDDYIVGWTLPPCPRKDGTVVCEDPSEI